MTSTIANGQLHRIGERAYMLNGVLHHCDLTPGQLKYQAIGNLGQCELTTIIHSHTDFMENLKVIADDLWTVTVYWFWTFMIHDFLLFVVLWAFADYPLAFV